MIAYLYCPSPKLCYTGQNNVPSDKYIPGIAKVYFVEYLHILRMLAALKEPIIAVEHLNNECFNAVTDYEISKTA